MGFFVSYWSREVSFSFYLGDIISDLRLRSSEIADIEDLISSDDSSSESSAHVAPDLDDSAIQIMRAWFRIAQEQEIREMNEHLSDAS